MHLRLLVFHQLLLEVLTDRVGPDGETAHEVYGLRVQFTVVFELIK